MLVVEPCTHRIHSLTGRITFGALKKAFKAVRRNRGAAGIDKQSIRMFEANLTENLLTLERELKDGSYWPFPLRRVYIPKGGGKVRPLGIPAVRCRVAQEVVRSLINPFFENIFHNNSHGFREERSCHTAMAQLVEYYKQGYRSVLDADIRSFFDDIPHKLILDMVGAVISDGNILSLIRKFLQAGVMEEGVLKPTTKGTPQGGVISPLLANIVLNHLDWTLERYGFKFVRYADDFVVLFKTKRQAEKAFAVVKSCIEDDLGLTLSEEKTKITTFGKGFVFLGFYTSARTIRMSPKAEGRFKDKIRDITVRKHNLDHEIVEKINRVLRGTVNYFHTSFSTCLGQLNRLDKWLRKRIRCMKFKRISKQDNCRLLNKHIHRFGVLTLRELYLAAN